MRHLAAVIAALAVYAFVSTVPLLLLGRNAGAPEVLALMVVGAVAAVWVGRRMWPKDAVDGS